MATFYSILKIAMIACAIVIFLNGLLTILDSLVFAEIHYRKKLFNIDFMMFTLTIFVILISVFIVWLLS